MNKSTSHVADGITEYQITQNSVNSQYIEIPWKQVNSAAWFKIPLSVETVVPGPDCLFVSIDMVFGY